MYVNINGFFTDATIQQSGLRQGDPLPQLLFNLAMESLFLHILQETCFSGYRFPEVPSISDSLVVKRMAYADDICVFLDDTVELGLLHYYMQRYSDVSNAKFNEKKKLKLSSSMVK